MTITTLGTAAHISPTVIKTFFKHYYERIKKDRQDRDTEATDELVFDEAFNVVKAFIELATSDTIESLQRFTNTSVPVPPWATSISTLVPIESCNQAADILKGYFGPDDLKTLVGGEKWWQVRGIAGVEAEWIAQSTDWRKMKAMEKEQDDNNSTNSSRTRKRDKRHEKPHERFKRHSRASASKIEKEDPIESATQDAADEYESEEMDRLKRVMLYIHGGGYYFGSLTTHRYQIIRYARKFGGRCFAPLYRKAPQYPWPCALQDCLAAYLFLIRPPPGSKHKPVHPSRLVIAGDSAGGGLSISLLTLIRDMELPMPAGAVLISPWCDLTHSFPSIMQNTDTDIIPPYSFVHKPSTLWPVPGFNSSEETNPAKKHSSSKDEPEQPVPIGIDDQANDADNASQGNDAGSTPAVRTRSADGEGSSRAGHRPTPSNKVPRAPKLLSSDPILIKSEQAGQPDVELRSQIQIYATNSQLTHPLCSPILHGSLGGLPPLYILAGDAEVLRDEIIYLAHRAANPEKYPLRQDLLNRSDRAQMNAERFNSKPTKVHLQIYDDMCHVLTAFAFTSQSRFAYRAVASFVKHVTGARTHVKNPFPQVPQGDVGPEDLTDTGEVSDAEDAEGLSIERTRSSSAAMVVPANGELHLSPLQSGGNSARVSRRGSGSKQENKLNSLDGLNLKLQPLETTTDSPRRGSSGVASVSPADLTAEDKSKTRVDGLTDVGSADGTASVRASRRGTVGSLADSADQETARQQRRRAVAEGVGNEYTGQVPLTRPSFQEFMIRERVNVKGFIRPLEPESDLPALQIKPDQIGIIKYGPCQRYLTGQELWAKKYAKTAKKVEKRRAKHEQVARRLLEEASRAGLLKPIPPSRSDTPASTSKDAHHQWTGLAAFGPELIEEETPPPSAISGRRDTSEAVALLRSVLNQRAKQHGGSKKLKLGGLPEQSVAESAPDGRTRHGLRLWHYLMVRDESRKVSRKRVESNSGRRSGEYIASTRKSALSRGASARSQHSRREGRE